ncbi:unnamed protein product [Gordionus sp. m RMFG-2023]
MDPFVDQSLNGVKLGFKALGIASIITITGFVGFCFITSKLLDIDDLEKLKQKAQNFLPRVSKTKNGDSNNIKTLSDLLEKYDIKKK